MWERRMPDGVGSDKGSPLSPDSFSSSTLLYSKVHCMTGGTYRGSGRPLRIYKSLFGCLCKFITSLLGTWT